MTTNGHPNGAPNRGGAVLLPLALIAAGILLLLANLGWISASFLWRAASAWPVILIAVGLDVLLRGRFRLVLVAVALAILAIFAAIPGVAPGGTVEAGSEAIQYERGGVDRLDLALEHGIGRLELGVLPAGDARLLAGTVRTGRGETLDRAFTVDGRDARLSLESDLEGPTFVPDGEERVWNLEVSPDVALDLDLDTGVGRAHVDLRDARLSRIDLDSGVGEVLLTLPGSGGYTADVDAGVGEVVVRIPRGTPVRLTVQTGLGRVDVLGAWTRDEDVYTSDGFAAADEDARAEVEVQGGVGTIRVEIVD